MRFINFSESSLKISSWSREEWSSVMSATSRAMSLASTMATLASAHAKAGESLIPSPTITTVCPAFLYSSTIAALSWGKTWLLYLEIPASLAMAQAAFSSSPVSITMFLKPAFFSARKVLGTSARSGSLIQIAPFSCPSTAK